MLLLSKRNIWYAMGEQPTMMTNGVFSCTSTVLKIGCTQKCISIYLKTLLLSVICYPWFLDAFNVTSLIFNCRKEGWKIEALCVCMHFHSNLSKGKIESNLILCVFSNWSFPFSVTLSLLFILSLRLLFFPFTEWMLVNVYGKSTRQNHQILRHIWLNLVLVTQSPSEYHTERWIWRTFHTKHILRPII